MMMMIVLVVVHIIALIKATRFACCGCERIHPSIGDLFDYQLGRRRLGR